MLPRHFLTALCFAILSVSAIDAASAEIEDFAASASGDSISVNLRLTHAFEESWRLETLQSGLPIAFVYQIELIRKRENWFDSVIDSHEIELVATYNSLTREYLLNYRKDRKLVSSENVRSLDELRKKMTTLSEDSIFDLNDRNIGRLRVKARAILGRRYLLHVIPRAVATDWEAVRVKGRSTP